jgi:hypothetical protein
MAPDEILNLIITYRKKVALFVLGIVLLIIAINLFRTYAIVDVEIDTGGNQSSKLTVYTSSDVATAKAGSAGLNIVPRNTKSLIVASGDNMKTQSKITIPWFGYSYKKVTLKRDKNAEKVAFNSTSSTNCASYSSNFDRLMYYSCQRPTSLSEYLTPTTGTWITKKIADAGFYTNKVTSYMGGVIGISYRENSDVIRPGEITAVTETGQRVYYSPPEGFNLDEIGKAKLFTDTNDITNNRFILVDTQGNIYLGTPTGGKNIDYKHISPPEKYNPIYNQTLCAVNGDSAHCYRGHAAVGDRPEKFDATQLADDTIVTLSFNDTNANTVKVEPSDFVLSDFYTTTTNQLYGKSHKKLYAFDKVGDKYIPDELSQNIDSAASSQNMYFIQQNGIYQVDSKTKDSYQIFHSNNIIPKSVYVAANKVFITGSIKGAGPTTYAYVLNSEDDTAPGKRLIDIFPTSFDKLPKVNSQDFIGNRFLFRLKVTINKDAKTIADAIDKKSLEQAKAQVINYINDQGINPDSLDISFTY